MSKLKSIFVSLYSTLATVIMFHSLIMLFGTERSAAWLALLASSGMASGFFGYLLITRSKARTTANLAGWTTAIVAAAMLALVLAATSSAGDSALIASYAVIAGGGWLAYVWWYSRLQRGQNSVLVVGKELPAFELEDRDGNPISTRQFIGRPAIYLFYRGNWCPLCMAQIKEIAAQYRSLAKTGAQLILISPQPHDHTRRLAEKFEVPFQFLVDVDGRAAKMLGIYHPNGVPFGFEWLGYESDTVFPTVVITDSKGEILFADLTDNYRVRPEPDTFVSVLQNHAWESASLTA